MTSKTKLKRLVAMKCSACGVDIALPTINPPPEARCYSDHSIIEGCACEPAIAKCRGNWVQEVFKPLPPDEAATLRDDMLEGR